MRRDEALYELLELELLLGDALAEVRYLACQLSLKEEDLTKARLELQLADESIDMLLREKADTLRKLTEAKRELVEMSTRAANLQHDLNTRVRRERELAGTSASTPIILARPRANSDENFSGPNINVRGILSRPALPRSGIFSGGDDADAVFSARGVKGSSEVSRGPARSLCKMRSTDRDSGRLSFVQTVGTGHLCSDLNGCAKWRRLFLESRRRTRLLEEELARAKAPSSGCGTGVDVNAPPREFLLDRSFAEEIQQRLRHSVAELGRLERELNLERERNCKQDQLELQLLKDVAHLARRLQEQEDMQGVLRVQRGADLNLSKEELLEELCRYRWALGALMTRVMKLRDGGRPQLDDTCEAGMTDGFATALENALRMNEALRAEKEYVLANKREREASYEMELRSRIAEMEELTTALDELREQVQVLKKERSSIGSLPTCLHADCASVFTRDKRAERNGKTGKAF